MHTIFTDSTMLTREIPTFFAGANTGEGFVSEYPTMANERELTRLWILKGGSGTGKSTFMRKVSADAAENFTVVHYLCSSDPDSLDAVHISDGERSWAILDGTAPHVWEMTYPGAASGILYLGKFWDNAKLAAQRSTLEALHDAKKEAYAAAYRSLAALAKLEETAHREAAAITDLPKLEGFCRRLLARIPKKDRAVCLPLPIPGDVCRTWSLSQKGVTCTDGLWRLANVHWQLEDLHGTATLLLEVLRQSAAEQGIQTLVSRHPIGDRIVELLLPALSLHLTAGPAHGEIPTDKTISMRRFLKKDPPVSKGQRRLRARLMAEIQADAIASFQKAGEAHRQIEQLYVPAMDFPKLNRDMNGVRKQILEAIAGGV